MFDAAVTDLIEGRVEGSTVATLRVTQALVHLAYATLFNRLLGYEERAHDAGTAASTDWTQVRCYLHHITQHTGSS